MAGTDYLEKRPVELQDDLLARQAKLSDAKRALLARRLRGEVSAASRAHGIPRRRGNGPAPLSFAQQRLWFLDQLTPGIDAYNIPATQRFRGQLDVRALKLSINEILRRHDVLRTVFHPIEGRPVQIVTPHVALPLPVTDLSQLTDHDREPCARRIADHDAQQPFDLAKGPLLRAKLLKLAPEDHILVLCMHHIVSDGWSMGVFFREMASLYGALSSGRPCMLPDLPLQYADFALWQRQRMAGQALEDQLNYWSRQLRDLPVLDLPCDYTRPAVQSFQGARQSFVLSEELTTALNAASRRHGTTLFMTMLAAFKVLLHRYSGQSDIVVGTPIAGRNYREIENLIGFFVNTLVLRTDLSGNPSFSELIARVRKVALDAYAHQDVPFEMLVETLQPRRDLSRTPLFQVFFNMVSFVDDPLEVSGLQVEDLAPSDTRSKFDLTLYAGESNGVITLLLVYSTDLFSAERVSELLRQYHNLLWQMIEKPGESISRLSLVTRAASALLPDPTAAMTAAWEGAIHEHFEGQAQARAEKVAIVDRNGRWSYSQLDRQSNRLANYLRANGIGSQDIVAIYADRCAALVCALLGVLKSGAAFMILDSAYPAQALIDRLRIAAPRAWLQTSSTLPPLLDEFVSGFPLCCRAALSAKLDDAPLAQAAESSPGVQIGPENPAYVAFTSGTSGVPKAVLGTHAPVSHFVRWHTATFGLNDTDRFSMLSGVSHDPLLRDVFSPLWLGATLAIADSEEIIAPGALREWLERERISVIHLTPALTRLLDGGPGSTLPFLRYAFFGADILTTRDLAALARFAPAAACVNFYGTTETPQAMGYFVIPPELVRGEDAIASQPVALGRGIEGAQLLVMNTADELAGTGELGEICVRSPYLTRGYLNDDLLTRQRYRTNPFTQEAGDRLYHTGDLGRYRPDGIVEYVRRMDDQIKIRGFRIEPREIEMVLADHPSVEACVVARHSSPEGDQRLVAYVVPGDVVPPARGELYHLLRRRLPDHMVPSAIVFLGALPLTANGKPDRRALPAPDLSGSGRTEIPTAPRTPVEEKLATIWSELLGAATIGVQDNFFALGGHSLLATQMISRIRNVFQVDFPVRGLFQSPTLADLADQISRLRAAGTAPEISSLARIAQRRLEKRIDPASPTNRKLP
jgi:amino acid adenylation domain-containing protein